MSNGVHSFCTYGADGMGALSFFLENLFLSEISGHYDRIPAMDEEVRAVC
ncbi:hypothetical protein CUS_7684 [Ruminococcus albus 8]|uniref:Uncharacterized protein n=1 Tax=Ruminococcus albus 8 TaxID=246199 RepID=E9SFW3_RUMAL|nr:hypothetical protein CUS_7684 [Ruminococcus albus 8]